jgi:hypothetical protein
MCPRSSAVPVGPRLCLFVLVGLVLTGVLTVSGTATIAQGVTTTDDDSVRTQSPLAAEQRVTPLLLENNTIEIAVNSSGDTAWTITWFYTLSGEDGGEQFRELARQFERDSLEELQTLSEFRNVSEQLDSEQARNIEITDVQRQASVNDTGAQTTGRLQLSFTWENFAEVDGNRIMLNDSLTTEQGLWLDGLAPDQNLIVRIPPGYGVFDASVDVRDGALRWRGPTTFNETTLQATFVGDGNTATTPTPTPTPTPGVGSNDTQWGLAALLVGALVVGGILVSLAVRYRDQLFDSNQTGTGEEPPAGGGSTQQTGDSDEPPEPTAASPTEISEELLSDEERVERLLENNGGRMKQAAIVDETDWSNAKVSQLLSSMEDEGRIDKLRIGRENLISFPDVDVTELENEE